MAPGTVPDHTASHPRTAIMTVTCDGSISPSVPTRCRPMFPAVVLHFVAKCSAMQSWWQKLSTLKFEKVPTFIRDSSYVLCEQAAPSFRTSLTHIPLQSAATCSGVQLNQRYKQAIVRLGLARDVSVICLNGKYVTASPFSTKLYAFL